jgi:hypothetical protein
MERIAWDDMTGGSLLIQRIFVEPCLLSEYHFNINLISIKLEILFFYAIN